jgi:hypothetical protein
MRALLALSIGDITFEVWKKNLMNRKKKEEKTGSFSCYLVLSVSMTNLAV